MDYFSFGFGFFVGILVLHMLYYLWDLGQVGLFLKEAERSSLILLAMSAESIAYIQAIKYETMKSLNLDENTIKMTKNIDDYNFEAWKSSSIKRLLTAYPSRYAHLPKYFDWSGAMKVLNDVYKKGHME